MGVLEDAIREHLDLKRKHGASETEVERQEVEALGPARREVAPPEPDAEAAPQDDDAAYDEAAPVAEEPAFDTPVEPDIDSGTPFDETAGHVPLAGESIVEEPGAAEHAFEEPVAEALPLEEQPVAEALPADHVAEDHPVAEAPPVVEPPPVEAARVEPAPIEDAPIEDAPIEAERDSIVDQPTEFFDVEDAAGDTPPQGFPAQQEAAFDEELLDDEDDEELEGEDGDVLEDTPDFLQDAPEHDRLWFEQKPPRDFDFD